MQGLQLLKNNKIIAILRGVEAENAVAIADALIAGGIKIIEVTLDSPNALEIVEQLAKSVPSDVVIGAGTVLNAKSAEKAIDCGAKLIVAPTLCVDTLKVTKKHKVLTIPGCFTPTEMLTAHEHGADAVKVFPASAVGPSFFKDVLGPLAHIPLIATGGVNEANMHTFLEAGAIAVGLGSSLVPKTIKQAKDLEQLRQQAEKLVAKVF